jgi:hypothetical protein
MEFSNFNNAKNIANKIERFQDFKNKLSSVLYISFDEESGNIVLTPDSTKAEQLPASIDAKLATFGFDVKSVLSSKITSLKTEFETLA